MRAHDSAIDRRRFVKAGFGAVAAALAAPSLLTLASPAGRRSARRIKMSLKWGMIAGDFSVAEKFALLKRLGYDGVEIDSPSDLDLDEVVRASRETGVAVEGVVDSAHWSLPLSSNDAAVRRRGADALRTALRDAKTVGASSVLLVPAVVNESTSYADAYARSQDEIRTVLPLAKELDVVIAIENVWNKFLLSPLEAARYIDEFESEHVGWHFDVGNIVSDGWPEQWIRILGRRIVKIDVKDFSRRKRDEEGLSRGFECEIGEGDVNWKAVRQALHEIGYDDGTRFAAAEVPGGDEKRLTDVLQRMDRALNVEQQE